MKREDMSARVCLLIALTTFVSPGTALAWDDEGHMIVAALAYDKLDPAVRARVDSLLQLNPQYKSWASGVAKTKKAKVAFMRAATWPDFIKDATGYQNDMDATGPDAARNIGYDDKLEHRYWHYKDLAFSADGTPTVDATAPNAETQIEAFRAVLADTNAADTLKSYDLVWLLHLVGDVHQPLHATSRFSQALPQGDQGGNGVKLSSKKTPNLHAYWDDILGTSKSATTAMKAAGKVALPPAGTPDLTTATWLRESEQVAESHVYVSPIGPGAGPYKLTNAYNKAARDTAEERVSLAGARLAAVLNTELK